MSEVVQIGRASTAASTAFTHERLDGPGGLHLWLDGNSKVTAGNGSYDSPAANAFSILDREDCPWRTPTCSRLCYVQNLAAAQPELHAMYRHNSETIRRILDSSPWYDGALCEEATDWADVVSDWIVDHARGGFRWHVSGDVFSAEYAKWIALVVGRSSYARPVKVIGIGRDGLLARRLVPHWIYTRSFHLLDPLLEVSTTRGGNLAINLSADKDNYWLARRLADEHGLRVCYLSTEIGDVPGDLKRTDVLFPDYPLRGPGGAHAPSETRAGSPFWESLTGDQRAATCPVDLYGKSDAVRCGPCRKCLE